MLAPASSLLPDAPPPPPPRVLLVDDDAAFRTPLAHLLTLKGFEVTTASGVSEALRLIGANTFDVLVSDLHMPHAGDGLTVVSAMHHFHPSAVRLILSGFPALRESATAIMTQPDGVLLKPIAADNLARTIAERLQRTAAPARPVEALTDLLEAEASTIVDDWMRRVRIEPHIVTVVLTDEARRAYVRPMLRDLNLRLRYALPLGSRSLISVAAVQHGTARRAQGYTAAMVVEESRMLQASILQTITANLARLDFDLLLAATMAIADEIGAQLAQSMAGFAFEAPA